MPPSSTPWISYLCLASSMSLVGSYVALTKPLVAAIPIFVLAWLRFAIAAIAMLPWLRKTMLAPKLAPINSRLLMFQAFFGNFLFSICMLYGVSLTSATTAAVVMASIPAVVALFSYLFLGENLDKRTKIAIALAVVGIVLFAWSKSEQPFGFGERNSALLSEYYLEGVALLCIAVVCEAVYAVIGKKLTQNAVSSQRISCSINLWGLLFVTPLAIWQSPTVIWGNIDLSLGFLLVFYALAASVWSVWLWMTGLRKVSAAHSGVFTVMLPISAATIGVVFLSETLNQVQFFALFLALLGVLVVTTPQIGKKTF